MLVSMIIVGLSSLFVFSAYSILLVSRFVIDYYFGEFE